ncbi:MAG: hypothetical protein IRY96_08585 [Burkholderiales bacterium]|nr:hypothetical protein [Burkholderiales bacterium]
MAQSRITDADFARMFEEHGPTETARLLGLTERGVYHRRNAVESRLGRQLTGPAHPNRTRHHVEHPGKLTLAIEDGTVLVGSDAHYWPGDPSTAHRAFVRFCRELQPKAIIKNGDVLDGATISRHAPIGWEKRPALIEEIEVCKERLSEIALACPKAERYWPLGNHDARFETRLATVAPEYARIHGVHLHEHFPGWNPCWMVEINDDVVVKHRYKGGIHAKHNNTVHAGKTMVTGHLHNLGVTAFSDYRGTRFGVDCGTMADPFGPQFRDYTEMNPLNWRSGFVVLTFRQSRLLWPEVVHVLGPDEVEFRGEIIRV